MAIKLTLSDALSCGNYNYAVRSKRLDGGIHEFLRKCAFQMKDIEQYFPAVLRVYNAEKGDYPF